MVAGFFVALGFVAFGIGGLIQLIVFPMLNVLVRDFRVRTNLARDFIAWSFASLIGFLRFSRLLDYKVIGAEKLNRRGLLIVANHPTFLDIVAQSVFHAPVVAANYIRNDEGEQLLTDCVAALERGENLIIFPEGTRTASDGSFKLQRGAAHVAMRARCNVTLPASRPQFSIEVQSDIDIQQFISQASIENLAARHLTDYLRDFFTKESHFHAIA